MAGPMVQIGLERLAADPAWELPGQRFGLLMNQASVDASWCYACDLLAARFPGRCRALFSPQHGLWGEQQANMVESAHGWYEPLRLPVFSLYSETREPTGEMLAGLDCLVVDLQDVGTRVYTFIWTVVNCLRACAARGIPVVVLDRPNPLGGCEVEGPRLEPGFESFVGLLSIPMRHGMTIGELALWANESLQLGASVEVVPMCGWRRAMLWDDLGRGWAAPSPNMPRPSTAVVYPGQVLLEGTNLSEGRGTTQPFECVGAPFIDPFQLVRELERLPQPGLVFRPIRFTPTFDKWRGVSCGGVQWHWERSADVRSFVATLGILAAVRRLWPNDFRWTPPPYEYERDKMPIDILYGSSRLREAFAGRETSSPEIAELAAVASAEWWRSTEQSRLYD